MSWVNRARSACSARSKGLHEGWAHSRAERCATEASMHAAKTRAQHSTSPPSCRAHRAPGPPPHPTSWGRTPRCTRPAQCSSSTASTTCTATPSARVRASPSQVGLPLARAVWSSWGRREGEGLRESGGEFGGEWGKGVGRG